MTRLAGKVAWITGAGSGIGQAAAVALAGEGAHVVLTGRRAEALAQTAGRVGSAASVAAGDVTDAARMAAIAAEIERDHGRLDIMVNNAGANVTRRKWVDLSAEGVDAVLSTNLHSVFYGVIAALPLMRARKDGLFIHVGSRAARVWDGPSGAAYIAAKSALIGLSHMLNREEFANGIRSTVFHPGETATPILASRGEPALAAADLARMLTPEDCADLIRYVACLPAHVYMSEVMLLPTWNRFAPPSA
jgi:NADP-dependent 3-hydroxy acid dehydrogenase YdfG